MDRTNYQLKTSLEQHRRIAVFTSHMDSMIKSLENPFSSDDKYIDLALSVLHRVYIHSNNFRDRIQNALNWFMFVSNQKHLTCYFPSCRSNSPLLCHTYCLASARYKSRTLLVVSNVIHGWAWRERTTDRNCYRDSCYIRRSGVHVFL